MSPLPRRALLGTGLALALPALGRAASTAQKPPAPTPPKARFGAALPLTGAEALQGDEALRGILLAIADVNAAGGWPASLSPSPARICPPRPAPPPR
ncbi:hypothetical protein GT370_13425 [Acidocella sp. MX-AZ03]|uniref:hypothetical protein n=1 Tax=Acidocella sp. MX-AZ03 TaxID=2697363 RepID=UPI0022DD81C3|nr:hypothetical protein [Acidocella sp. MX-AZ03]WBO58219.1 hypothetical protein GT370_13425 [Acidocella sp. MX-AZ03]